MGKNIAVVSFLRGALKRKKNTKTKTQDSDATVEIASPDDEKPQQLHQMRASSCRQQDSQSNSDVSKMSWSRSMRASSNFSKRLENKKKLKPEDSIWKKTIILGEKCRVRDEDDDDDDGTILYDKDGNRISAYRRPINGEGGFGSSRQNPATVDRSCSSRLG